MGIREENVAGKRRRLAALGLTGQHQPQATHVGQFAFQRAVGAHEDAVEARAQRELAATVFAKAVVAAGGLTRPPVLLPSV